MRGTNEGGMRNGKHEAQMRTNGKREAQMRANVETRNGKRECTSGPPYVHDYSPLLLRSSFFGIIRHRPLNMGA